MTFSEHEFTEAAVRMGEDFVGTGCSSLGVGYGHNRLVAMSYWGLTPTQAKVQYYLQSIYSTIFPHNFPHFYAAFGLEEEQPFAVAGTVRERIRRNRIYYQFQDVATKWFGIDGYRLSKKFIRYPFSNWKLYRFQIWK